jgi:hypothetical protein
LLLILRTPRVLQLAAIAILELVNNPLESMSVIKATCDFARCGAHFWVLTAVKQEKLLKVTKVSTEPQITRCQKQRVKALSYIDDKYLD